jgi:hypothetical protein
MENYEFLETIHLSPSNEVYKVRSLRDNHVYTMKIFLDMKNLGTLDLHYVDQH